MNLDPRKLLLFALRLLLTFPLMLWVYLQVLPMYQAAVLAVANVPLEIVSPAMQIGTDPAGRWRVAVDESGARPDWVFTMGGEKFSQLVFLNLAVLPSLLVATPTGFLERFRLLGWGLALLFSVQVLSIVACVFSLSRLCFEGPSLFCNNLSGILSPGGEVSAVALWGLLSWRHWFPRSFASFSSDRTSTRSPTLPTALDRSHERKRSKRTP